MRSLSDSFNTHYPAGNQNTVALKAFFNITRQWKLDAAEESKLLGVPLSTLYRWRNLKKGPLSLDTLERISYVLGIYKALKILLPSQEAALQWIRKENSAPLFNGKSALDKLLQGHVVDLADVRRYLDSERNG